MASAKKPYSRFKLFKQRGVVAILIHNGKVLIMKRIWLPFIRHPGVWTFPAGKIEKGESNINAVYRELAEETGVDKADLTLLGRYAKIMKIDEKDRKRIHNTVYVFRSKTDKIRLNMENTGYKWISLDDIKRERTYTNVFADKRFIERAIRGAINGKPRI